MHERRKSRQLPSDHASALASLLFLTILAFCSYGSAQDAGVAVGPQYDTTHVYVAPADFDALVNSFVATFGGKPSKRIVGNVTPVASSTEMQYILSPVGALSIFAFQTPVPFPFGEERTGYLVTDMDQAIKAARSAGAEVIVEPFKDPIGMDAVIQWPGGVKMQLYWHFTPSTNPPLETVPDNRVYVSRDQADHFVSSFVSFAHGKVVAMTSAPTPAKSGALGKLTAASRSRRYSGTCRCWSPTAICPIPSAMKRLDTRSRTSARHSRKPKPPE